MFTPFEDKTYDSILIQAIKLVCNKVIDLIKLCERYNIYVNDSIKETKVTHEVWVE